MYSVNMVKETKELILTRCLVCAWFGCSEESNYHNRDEKTIEFIEKARDKQGWKYNYENTVYIRSKDKVTIKCEEHEEFKQAPSAHLSGQGCPMCGGSMPSDTESFIKRANMVHNNRYSYSKVDYKNAYTKVTITCKLHGDFSQTPASHKKGHGCLTCGGSMTSDTKSFIKKANMVHNNRYTYYKVDYKKCDTKVTITCKLHGDFKQRPYSHLFGCGCPTCGGSMPSDTKSFIKKANIVHNNRYTYYKVDYKNCDTKVTITCKLHGDFEQTPYCHSSGQGCPTCGGSMPSDTESFIKKATKVHNNRYIYSKVDYINTHTKVTITCKLHGDFEQTPANHLRNCGCPKCQLSKGELTINTYLINNKISFEYQYKIEKYRYDYFIPYINTLIEYDGKQHFDPTNYFNGKRKDGFNGQKIRDLKKTKLALKYGYKIVRIPYTEYEQIDTILQGILENPRNLIVSSNKEEINSIYKAHVDLTIQYEKNNLI